MQSFHLDSRYRTADLQFRGPRALQRPGAIIGSHFQLVTSVQDVQVPLTELICWLFGDIPYFFGKNRLNQLRKKVD